MEDEDSCNGDSDGASSLDHALLESLFYNEMLLMEESAPLCPPDLRLITSPVPPNAAHHGARSPEPLAMPESALLNDLSGVVHEASMNGSVQSAMPAAPEPWMQSSGVPPAAAGVSAVSQARAQQLVSQFATLASRLGISLPPSVLSSLTASAAVSEAQNAGTAAEPIQPPVAAHLPPQESTFSAAPTPATAATITLKVQQLQSTAEAAIAAVTETRKRKDDDPPASAAGGSKPLYSKRRKKARLSDCESKLAALRSENEMLKRHLATVTNKAHIFDEERKQAELEMRRTIQEGASPEKLNPLLSKFTEMYSDYGRHRHQELTFHLGQLEKLAAPTTFTKMGLWTLGQNEGFYTNPKRNPIAGILRKELGITPVQGRKILEQRQKIRDVCDNLKQCLVLLGKLKGICEHKQKVFHDRMTKVQTILTPLQVVKLLLWVDEHSHLLESVCPGWGSERIRSKESKPKAT